MAGILQLCPVRVKKFSVKNLKRDRPERRKIALSLRSLDGVTRSMIAG